MHHHPAAVGPFAKNRIQRGHKQKQGEHDADGVTDDEPENACQAAVAMGEAAMISRCEA